MEGRSVGAVQGEGAGSESEPKGVDFLENVKLSDAPLSTAVPPYDSLDKIFNLPVYVHLHLTTLRYKPVCVANQRT